VIVVTGGTGFIGSQVTRALLASGRRVRILARDPQRAQAFLKPGGEAAGSGRTDQAPADLARGDIQDRPSLEAAFRGMQAVIHLVGIIQEKGRNTFDAVHHRGVVNVVEAARAARVKRLVHMSALGTRPNARSEYHRTKWLGEEAVRKSGLDWTIHRPSIVYGKGDGFTTQFISLIRKSPVLPVPGDGKNRMQPVWVGDVASCFLQSLDRDATKGKVYELGGPRAYTLNEILDHLLETLGKRRLKVHVPLGVLRSSAAILERVLPAPPVTCDQLLMLEEDNVCDTTAMRRDFDVEMPDLREGLRSALA
jgi:NADH dehydrogenase